MSSSASMGFFLFVLGSVLTAGGLIAAGLGYATNALAGWTVMAIAVGQTLSVASVAFLSDDRYERLSTTDRVLRPGARRHIAGLSLLALHVLAYLLVWSGGVLSYARGTSEDPFPTVFGLTFEAQGPAFIWGVVAAELLFWAGVYLLGPEWWQRFKALFRYQAPSTAEPEEAPRPPPTLRYRLGLAVFAIGNLMVLTGMALPAIGLRGGNTVGLIAVLMGGGEVVSLASIFLLGKEGFKELKSRLFGVLRRPASGDSVTPRRHRAGCVLLLLHIVLQLAALVFPIASHYGVAAEGTFPAVLGLSREAQLEWFVGLLAAAELLFFAGIYSLGADWWGRFRDLFRTAP